jgi:3'-phosphoadenosine 5'-phosphosulfate sulfotransferase (PAPS reductase)/FAD synthetase
MIKIVVPISGGKDSQACLKLALQEYDKSEVLGLFCDTQFEHPLTYAHIDWMREFYGVPIERVCAGSVKEKILGLTKPRFPGGKARFFTDQLKIIPSKIFYKELAEKQGSFQVWLGMRSDESHERKVRYQDKINTEVYAPNDVQNHYHKYLENLGVMFRLPVLDLSTNQIFEILDGEYNPLYAAGFDRLGCFPCLASGDYWKRKAFIYDETGRKHWEIVKDIELQIGKSVFTSKNEAMRNNKTQNDVFTGCAICAI